jgi:RNA polymerase sigma-70 factor (ECF subfamily)
VNEQAIQWVRAASRGDQAAYDKLIKDHAGFVYTMAFRMTGDHHWAEDLCQEIFIKAWMNLKKLKKPEAFSGWLATLARRSCLNAIEKRKRRMEVGEGETELENLKPTMPPSFDNARTLLEEAIARLSLRDRQLITLSYLQELSSDEVARIMEIPPGTVRVYLMRAREKLKNALKGHENELF